MLLTLLIPSFVLAYACATDQGPWAAHGNLGSGSLTDTLVLLSPLALWATGWLFPWRGDDTLEPRAVICAIASMIGLAICAWHAFVLDMNGLANSLS